MEYKIHIHKTTGELNFVPNSIELNDTDFRLATSDEIAAYRLKNKANNIRSDRETICFAIINRGQAWYDTLTEQQKYELRAWYQAWLNAPATLQTPTKPSWLV